MKKKVIYHTSLTLNEQDQDQYLKLKYRWKVIEIFRRGLEYLLKNEEYLMSKKED